VLGRRWELKVNFNSEEYVKPKSAYSHDIDKNLFWSDKFIKNFNDIYHKESQSFFIKRSKGDHKEYIAFIFHPHNYYFLGNYVSHVYVDQPYDLFLKDMKTAFLIINQMNKQYLLKEIKDEPNRTSKIRRISP
jgi:hypothetical protein